VDPFTRDVGSSFSFGNTPVWPRRRIYLRQEAREKKVAKFPPSSSVARSLGLPFFPLSTCPFPALVSPARARNFLPPPENGFLNLLSPYPSSLRYRCAASAWGGAEKRASLRKLSEKFAPQRAQLNNFDSCRERERGSRGGRTGSKSFSPRLRKEKKGESFRSSPALDQD